MDEELQHLGISGAVIKHHGQIHFGEKSIYFTFHFQVTVCHRGRSGQELKQTGTDAEAVEECCLLAGTACPLMAPWATSPGGAPSTVGWVLPRQLSYQENGAMGLLRANLAGTFFSTEIPFFHVTRVCVKLT